MALLIYLVSCLYRTLPCCSMPVGFPFMPAMKRPACYVYSSAKLYLHFYVFRAFCMYGVGQFGRAFLSTNEEPLYGSIYLEIDSFVYIYV